MPELLYFRPRQFLLTAIALAIAAGAHAQDGPIDIGRVDVRAGDRRVIPVAIVSDNAEFRQLAERAFNAHGGYSVARDSAQAAFTFVFQQAGASQASVEIRSGNPPRVQAQRTVAGTSERNALLRAADYAVSRTSGRPGFFAGRLAFVSDRTGAREIYTSDFFLGEMVQLTNDRSDSIGPRWSPDGQVILYTGYFQSGFPDIFRIDLANRARRPLVTARGTNTGARFSPDGSRIAMVLSATGSPEIYISDRAGRQFNRLTRTNAVQASPSWSPDGSQLVFTSDRDGRPQLFIMPAGGGNMRRIPTNISGYCAEPHWNPRYPNLIAFTAAMGGRFAVAVYDLNTRESRWVSRESGDAVYPVWTNDGRHLIYTARTPTASTLMLLDTESGKAAPLSGRAAGKVSQADFWIAR